MPQIGFKIPAGVYVLTAQGEMGVYDDHQELRIDQALTQALAGHLDAYLAAYRADPQAGDRRLGILYESAEPRPWGTLTFSLEDAVLRSLYPVGGRHDSALTAFQQKQREMSFYRGMEMLLEDRVPTKKQARGLCPVVHECNATLSERRSALGAHVDDLRDTGPVLDVLNLFGGGITDRQCARTVGRLAEHLRERLIRTGLRRGPGYTLVDGNLASAGEAGGVGAYEQEARDKRLQRELTLPNVDARRLHETDRIETIERWLRIPHQAVEVSHLRQFAPFRELNEQQVTDLRARSLVYTAPAGTRLLERGLGDAWNFYLLEGSVMLTPADGMTLRIDGGSEQAAFPVAFLKPRIYNVDTLTPVSFLWVHDQLLQALQNSRNEN